MDERSELKLVRGCGWDVVTEDVSDVEAKRLNSSNMQKPIQPD